ncbi:MAG: M23 family metallopeptidase [Clostridium sp.]|uniref:M23 family metallopeptidase n=1 Tax=Clostridium sp. TaxID=1506 RepID=UPI0025BBDCCF|nr:M23 family metallopeptidase [Clostridium sp.]MCI9303658.1 M23 family metallopeptidase [Clostridium sp.]
MDQNKKNKVKDFFRREGFYVVLFVCLCLVATVAAFTVRKNSISKEQNKVNNELSLNEADDNISSKTDSNFNKQNAERVENNDELANNNEENLSEPEVANVDDEVANNENQGTEVAENQTTEVTEEETADVSAGTDTEVVLSLPIDGNIAISREFGKMIRTYSDENRSEDTSRRGIDINASVGTVVKAAAEGKVEEVSSNTTDGTYVVIAHANGLKTKYTNLSEEVKVAVEDVVNAGTEIGTVGNTSGIFTSKVCGDVLNVQVQDANGNDVNPSSYFNFK